MQKYQNKAIGDLAAELTAGLSRLKKGYVDAAEALLQILDDEREYPYDFVVYRLTGYRPGRIEQTAEGLLGSTLRGDLLKLMLDVCDSFELRTSDYAEPVEDTESLARRMDVSTKTIQRWRHRGLPARRLVFPEGEGRVAFLASSVQWFVHECRPEVVRSAKFSQMSAAERRDILRRARRMSLMTRRSLSDVAKHLAKRAGRAVETIRYTIRKHDVEHPDDPIFPYLPPPLADEEKLGIYRGFLRGVPAPTLARTHRRTRGSIYRIINDMRARHILHRPISFIPNPQFDLPHADEILLAAAGKGDGPAAPETLARLPADLPPYLKALYEVPLLTAEQERRIFCRYNYLKYKADKLRKQIDLKAIRTGQLKEIESLLLQANVVKNQIVRANLRLVVSIARKHVGMGPQILFELISDGNVTLMKAVEKFDYARGNRLSTYASWAIMRSFARSVPRERVQIDRFPTGQDDLLDIVAGLQSYDPNEVNVPELRESIDAMLAQLMPRERAILIDHYGLAEEAEPKTLEELGRQLGISKERVRQIETQALKKLRKIVRPEKMGLPS